MKIFSTTLTKIMLTLSLSLAGVFAFAQEAQEPLYVVAQWNQESISVENTWPQDPEEGFWFYQLSSEGTVFRNYNSRVHLTFENSLTGAAFRLCSFDPGPTSFAVSFPSCATGDQNVPPITNELSPFQPSQRYLVYFTNDAGQNISDSDVGVGQYLLPEIPGPELPQDIVSAQETVLPHPSGTGEYYNIAVTINETIPFESLSFRLRTVQQALFVEPALGTVPLTQGVVTLPLVDPDDPLDPGAYELVVEYNGSNIEVIPLAQRIGGGDGSTGSTGPSDGGSSGGIFSALQEEILADGIVPNCGYDIRTQSNPNGAGRICGLADLVLLIQRIIEYIFILILPIAAIIFAYVGYLLMTSGGNADKKSKAKKAMTSLVIGILIILAAWLLVKSVVVSIGVNQNITDPFLNLDS